MGLKDNGLIRSFSKRFKRKANPIDETSEASGVAKIGRSRHSISRKNISKDALKVLYRFKEEGFSAYLVGGGVRDLLLGRKPKDFDIVTDARPEQVRKIFRNSRIIGRRFRLVHVYFKNEIIEVSTFRANAEETTFDEERIRDGDEALVIRSDNVYGTIEEDAWRRDFTVNALYYGVGDFAVVDYTEGMADIASKQIRIIGDPTQRFHEDPIRLLRAIRLAAKLDFQIEPHTQKPVLDLAHLLRHVPNARLLDEISKLFFEGHAVVTYAFLKKTQYFAFLFPVLEKILQENPDSVENNLIKRSLEKTDYRFAQDRRLTAGFLLAVFLWPVVQRSLKAHQKKGEKFFKAIHQAMSEALQAQAKVCLITKRMKAMMQAVWMLQYHLERRKPKRVMHLLKQRYFRAAFDLLELRAEVNGASKEIYKWWHDIQFAKPKKQKAMVDELQ